MLAKIFGLFLLVIGGVIAFKIAMALIGMVLGIAAVAVVLLLPVALLYWGYRLLTRERRRPMYY